MPDDVVVRAGLVPGAELDRPALRRLRRELRRAEALTKAGRVLARRDVSESALRARLERGGLAPVVVEEATETLRRAGALDDNRFARGRAHALADRGWGDEAIRLRLEGEGASPEAARDGVAELQPERERAARLVAGLPPRKAASLLARKGFDPDTVEATVPWLDVDEAAELR